MSTIDSARRYEALDHVSQALTLLERVQIRWRRYADTIRFANDAVPVELILRTAKNILTRPTDAHLAETARMLPAVILAMRAINVMNCVRSSKRPKPHSKLCLTDSEFVHPRPARLAPY